MSIRYLVRSFVNVVSLFSCILTFLTFLTLLILPGPAVNGLSCSVVPADPLLKFNYVLCFFFYFFGEANKINKILLN